MKNDESMENTRHISEQELQPISKGSNGLQVGTSTKYTRSAKTTANHYRNQPQLENGSFSIVDLLSDSNVRPGIAATAYDTAWLASLPNDQEPSEPLFPEALHWLLENQLPDGSWGGAVRYEHDRILCTLAAIVPLVHFGKCAKSRTSVNAGTRYLWKRGHLLAGEPTELVAFELLIPTLVRRAQAAGISVPPHLDIYAAQRVEKMKLIPAGALYSPRVTTVHSLEFLGEDADLAGLQAAQGTNGSIGNSPAATAFFYKQSKNKQALTYLESCLQHSGGEQVPVLYPCDTYELLWSAYHLFLAGVPVSRLLNNEERAMLQDALKNGGVSLSPSFPIPDADDTAVALIFLHELGLSPDPAVLQAFALPDGHFASFRYERHSSVGVSVHVLHALLRVPGYPNHTYTIDRLLDYLASQQIGGLYWLDKWHISPYYATAHALCVLRELPPEQASRMKPLVDQSRAWLRQTQNKDGSWGFYGQSTTEETAYALLALATTDSACLTPNDIQSCDSAASFLHKTITRNQPFPPLWIDKCLYTPTLIVQAVIESALEAYQQIGKRNK